MIDTVEFKTKASLDSLSLNKMQMSSGQNVVYVKPGGQNATSYSYRLKGDPECHGLNMLLKAMY